MRLRAWLVRRLTQPQLGEVRDFHGTAFVLVTIDYRAGIGEAGSLIVQLTYAPLAEHTV